MPLPSAPPSLPATPIPPDTTAIIATTISPNTHLLRDLHPERVLKLQSEHEGNINVMGVSPKDLLEWRRGNLGLGLIEDGEIRYEYNFLNECFIIKCMRTPTHDSPQNFFNETIFLSLTEKVGPPQARGLVKVGSGTTFKGFDGDRTGSSEKQPDAYVRLRGAQFPTVVCEAGWAESHGELREDAWLWLQHTGGGPLQAANGESEDEEQTVVDGINESTDLNDLAKKLIELNRHRKLKLPLVGSLEATLYVYRETEDHNGIAESFRATVLPPPPVDVATPREFGLTVADLLGDMVSEGQDPRDLIMFSLEGLQEFVMSSIPETEQLIAASRAEKLMVEAGVWENRETFRQARRRRLNVGG